MTMISQRDARIDLLRGAAIFGVLLINIWAFTWGFGDQRFGVVTPDMTWLDSLIIFLCSALVEQKAYPVMAVLLGAGMAMQNERHVDLQVLRRRAGFLLLAGIVHGVVLWSGDILTYYGLTAFLLIRIQARRLTTLRRIFWLCFGYLCLLSILVALSSGAGWSDIATSQREALAMRHFLSVASFGGLALQRIEDYALLLLNGFFMLPHVLALFLLGVFAVRLGWLTQSTHRARNLRRWQRVRLFGLGLGLPLNLLLGLCSMMMVQSQIELSPWLRSLERANAFLTIIAAPVLAAGLVAIVMLARENSLVYARAIFAPVGRMALTNYLAQSVLCLFILQSPGFGLAEQMTPTTLMQLAGAILLLQVGFSRWWLARFRLGPVEWAYRHFSARRT